eukprot:TRINITY_DN3839_c0_g1_i2.p1 TRINITY_DN3839_c0_g1~~TRINITY_DN3839_c0_g1_i2.p1  ORF type:complete len:209 (-),score=33.14 TRINITY_DN3839_c0_g1_i2:27-653(-)
MMGCSNPHPHCQIWSTSSVPTLVQTEIREQKNYYCAHGKCLLCSYLQEETALKTRVVLQNNSFTVVIPFWANWPYETLLISNRHFSSFLEIGQNGNSDEIADLAQIMIQLATLYDNLFSCSFPYSMGFHQAPTGRVYKASQSSPSHGDDGKYFHFHAHYYPPLLRSSTIKKHIVGFELLAMDQRDITAESAANTLRQLPNVHYTKNLS